MSNVQQFPGHPDLGKPKVAIEPALDGELIGNMAYIVEMARTGDTEQCRRFYRAFRRAWAETEGSPITKQERERQAFLAALKAVDPHAHVVSVKPT